MISIRLVALLLAVGSVASACGQDETPGGETPTDSAGTSLTITVTTDEGAEREVMRLTCDPPGGDHPNPEAACDRLAAAGASAFEPVPADQACTEIYGGPQTATVTGTFEGAAVDASFSRENGCQIDRWDTLGTEVFDVPLQ